MEDELMDEKSLNTNLYEHFKNNFDRKGVGIITDRQIASWCQYKLDGFMHNTAIPYLNKMIYPTIKKEIFNSSKEDILFASQIQYMSIFMPTRETITRNQYVFVMNILDEIEKYNKEASEEKRISLDTFCGNDVVNGIDNARNYINHMMIRDSFNYKDENIVGKTLTDIDINRADEMVLLRILGSFDESSEIITYDKPYVVRMSEKEYTLNGIEDMKNLINELYHNYKFKNITSVTECIGNYNKFMNQENYSNDYSKHFKKRMADLSITENFNQLYELGYGEYYDELCDVINNAKNGITLDEIYTKIKNISMGIDEPLDQYYSENKDTDSILRIETSMQSKETQQKEQEVERILKSIIDGHIDVKGNPIMRTTTAANHSRSYKGFSGLELLGIVSLISSGIILLFGIIMIVFIK